MPAIKQWERDYWDAQPEQQTCRDCGRQDCKAYVQPQLPSKRSDLATHQPYALCADCITAINRRLSENRKAQLAETPRCEIPGCEHRGTWNVARVLLCGNHKRKALCGHARAAGAMGALALFGGLDYDRSDVLRWATGKNEAAQ